MNKKTYSNLIISSIFSLAIYQPAFAFGDFLKDMASDIATTTAKAIAKEQNIQGADEIIDGVANANKKQDPLAARKAALQAANARRANQQVTGALAQQYPAHTSDLNGDGIVTLGEVQQIQGGYRSNTPPAQASTTGGAVGKAVGGLLNGFLNGN